VAGCNGDPTLRPTYFLEETDWWLTGCLLPPSPSPPLTSRQLRSSRRTKGLARGSIAVCNQLLLSSLFRFNLLQLRRSEAEATRQACLGKAKDRGGLIERARGRVTVRGEKSKGQEGGVPFTPLQAREEVYFTIG
jgi:hypothetical protein